MIYHNDKDFPDDLEPVNLLNNVYDFIKHDQAPVVLTNHSVAGVPCHHKSGSALIEKHKLIFAQQRYRVFQEFHHSIQYGDTAHAQGVAPRVPAHDFLRQSHESVVQVNAPLGHHSWSTH